MTPEAAVWETLPHSAGHHLLQEERSTSNPQRHAFLTALLILLFPQWKKPSPAETPGSFFNFLRPRQLAGEASETRNLEKSRHNWLKFCFTDYIFEICGMPRSTFIKQYVLEEKEFQKISCNWTWSSIVFWNSLGSLNFLYLANDLVSSSFTCYGWNF